MILNTLVEELSKIEEVSAIALAGSMTSLINDELSDYDLYIYYKSNMPSRETRREVLSKHGKCNVGFDFFEEGDELFSANDKPVDIMYREIEWIKSQVEDVWLKHNGRIGYTTCFIYNVKTSDILFDKTGELTKLKEICSSQYPSELRENIIKRNMMLIDGDSLAPYIKQIELAAKRDDKVSLLHRTTALLASYFDILFAYSSVLHPGEKKLIKYIEALKVRTPNNFSIDIDKILSSIDSPKELIDSIHSLLKNLHLMLDENYR